MEQIRYIVWLLSQNKKVINNQFHTYASSIEEAIENMNNYKGENNYKVMGISIYDSLCVGNDLSPEQSFINNRFL
jgi:hypothetical protein